MTRVAISPSQRLILSVCGLLLACGCSGGNGSGTNPELVAGTGAPAIPQPSAAGTTAQVAPPPGTAGSNGVLQAPAAGTTAQKPNGAAGSTPVQPTAAGTNSAQAGMSADAGTPADAGAPARDGGVHVVVPPITVTGPITGGMGKPFAFAVVDLGTKGYTEKEFFFEGDASAYTMQGQMSMDGKWALAAGTKAYFKSRMLVRRPMDAAKFNGTVIVEWFNVTGGADADPGFIYNSEELIREGYAWVGVSAQAQGVVGGGFAIPIQGLVPLVQYDKERYSSLSHPGDAYSFDIFTRAAQIVRGASSVDVLEGLSPKRLIGYGESQSAGRLVSYVNGVHPLVDVLDGFFIHSRGSSGPSFSTGTTTGPGVMGDPVHIRDDIDVPVFQFETETDVFALGYLSARQDDFDKLRTWEVAGTSHIDAYSLSLDTSGVADSLGCDHPNDGPQHYVVRAALHGLDRWLRDGTAPAKGQRLMSNADDTPLTDQYGNTHGGVRTPDVDVPTATLSGLPATTGGLNFVCFLFGHTEPFTPQKLMQMYPQHDGYVSKVTDAARAAREAGFILVPEEQAMVAKAQAAPVPK